MVGAAGRLLLTAAVCALFAGCGTRLPPRPGGTSTPSPEAATHFAAATAHCATLRTLTAELSLSGRAGDERVRGRVITGLARGGSARLEGVAPFGAPVFILTARAERARLLLPRDRRVLDDTPVSQVIERLTGLALGADDLLRALAGCGGTGEAGNSRRWSDAWEAVDTADGRTAFLRQEAGAWRVVAIDGGGWRADYRVFQNGLPREVRLRSDDDRVNLLAAVQQLEVNTPIDEAAFEVEIPADTDPMTLDELRSVAPLRTP
jgi:outer membrane biogenesis lipoprotein LolB